ncbi:hypothetical protein BaRGS_00014281 [Batillaria attramentaria]|uniref:Uncharacterized protein n=1 Tax=Batillaria attramentaria TaxID=370345 RepID=A0ABD0L4Q3_9CAEN
MIIGYREGIDSLLLYHHLPYLTPSPPSRASEALSGTPHPVYCDRIMAKDSHLRERFSDDQILPWSPPIVVDTVAGKAL